ncbi:MAG: hypothetical protein NZL95_02340 [Chitinophagales bacterium]|nr:hypothetical protein [Chitinophagales bacterium]MDW8427372.1 hypothetical protein [Chitinophagales bacterium]
MNAYYIFNEAHSGWRWIVLALGAVVLIQHLLGWINGNHFRKMENRMSLWFLIATDIQLVLGLILYVVLSPFTRPLFAGEDFMSDDLKRFYTIEHPILMLAAIALVHIGRARQKSHEASHAKFRIGTIFYGLALVVMLVGIRW